MWVRLHFSHFFDPSVPMRTLPQFDSLPRGFYFRIVAIRGAQISEIIHLPGGLVLKSTEGIGQGLSVDKEESSKIRVRHSKNDTIQNAMHHRVLFGPKFKFRVETGENIREGTTTLRLAIQ